MSSIEICLFCSFPFVFIFFFSRQFLQAQQQNGASSIDIKQQATFCTARSIITKKVNKVLMPQTHYKLKT
jgi:hypothetical protein